MNIKKNRALALRAVAALLVIGASTALSGCLMDPSTAAPLYSRLPAEQSGISPAAQPLSPEEMQRYNTIDRQALTEQDRAMAVDSAAQAWSRSGGIPISISGGYYSGGWGGSGWGTGIGLGGWGWGW